MDYRQKQLISSFVVCHFAVLLKFSILGSANFDVYMSMYMQQGEMGDKFGFRCLGNDRHVRHSAAQVSDWA